MKKKKPMIILTGPTAVGKTALSIQLAKAVDGEIVSADSMQVYRHMDIGSAKITSVEMMGVPHHLIDILEPWEDFNVTAFQKLAKTALEQIYQCQKIPIIAGGTGFYIQSLLYDIDFKDNDGDPQIRHELEQLAVLQGNHYLHQMLFEIDPESAANIHENNQKRVIRAIEYFRQTGELISKHNSRERERESPYDFFYYVLHTDRDILYERINQRVDLMMDQGLVEEVEELKRMGCRPGMVSMQGLGYKEIYEYLVGECSLEEAVDQIKRDTRHFAKRQLTWFKRERDVEWLYLPDFDNDSSKVLERIQADINKKWSKS